MDASPAPQSARSLLLRRAVAFAIDWQVASFAGERLAAHLPFATPRSVALLVAALGVFAWWFVLEVRFGTTPGKRLAGLVVAAADGGRAAPRALLVRALVLAACFGWDVSVWFGHVTGGRVPAALLYLREGLACSYLLHALLAISRPGGRALHDLWSGTQVVRRGAVPGPVPPPWPAARASAALWATGVVVALVAGLWGPHGPDLARFVPPAGDSRSVDRDFERLIRERTGLRSRVRTGGDVHWRTGAPTLRVARLDVELPWSAFADGRADSVHRAALEQLRVDPGRWDRIHSVVRAQRTVLLITWRQKREFYAAFDEAARRWREAPPDHGMDEDDD